MIDCPGIVPSSNAKDSTTETVLKGVVRVEALPVPSDHIPAVLERVKPVYISRTYGVPLPDDGRDIWEPEEFLEKLARIKGRLLKAGQPDIEGVAKIVLSDWVRGRIPFFVAPPERKDAAPQPEVKKAKGKAEEKKVLGVKQNLGSIMQKNKYDSQDIQPLDQEFLVDTADSDEIAEDDEEEVEEALPQDEDLELDWEEAFGAVQTAQEPSKAGPSGPDDEEKRPTKEPRKTTNKKKAENFFTNANVKNKNREKAAVMRVLSKEAGRKGAGRGGRGGKARR
jgi:nuclear GTP-binding protein